MASDYIVNHYIDTFSGMWTTRLQRTMAKFLPYVGRALTNGKRTRFNQLEKKASREISGRATATIIDERVSYHRWYIPRLFELSEQFDQWDDSELANIVLPTSNTMEQHVYAYNRDVDKVIVAAIEGNATTGETGATTTAITQTATLGTAITLVSIANIGLAFDNADIEYEGRCLAISPSDNFRMVTEVAEAQSTDFVTANRIVSGHMDNSEAFLGFKILMTTGLTWPTTTTTNVLAWHKDQIKFGDGERRVFIDRLPSTSQAKQIYSTWRVGAYRNEEKGVYKLVTTNTAH